jgi:hypothetical protein
MAFLVQLLRHCGTGNQFTLGGRPRIAVIQIKGAGPVEPAAGGPRARPLAHGQGFHFGVA